MIDGWRYYNHALMPVVPPHLTPNINALYINNLWKNIDKRVLLIRYTTDFDCEPQTNWWYVIKDEPFDITSLKAKRRYEINKGNKNFNTKTIDVKRYKKEIYEIQKAAYSIYPKKYRPSISFEGISNDIDNWNFYKSYGAFDIDGNMVGYALLNRKENYIYYAIHKVMPCCEKRGINAAIIYQILNDHKDFLSGDGYICDGARNILHETAFQNYLEKYFGFRKAYCKLHIIYRPTINLLIRILYPFRKIFYKLDSNRLIHNINGIFKMEEAKYKDG